MTDDDAVRFTLDDSTIVTVKKVTNNKYDFELIVPNRNRKTFIWSSNSLIEFADRKGNVDVLVDEAIKKFKAITNL